MRSVCMILLALVACGVQVSAQKVAKEKLNKLVSDFAKDGFKLENAYAPDFSSPHPNMSSRFIPCYQGRTVIVAAVMAFKPASLQFKVMLKGKEAPKSHELENIGTNGDPLFYDYRVLKFGPHYVSSSQNCVNVILFDKTAIDKPMYTLIFTKADK